MAKPQFELVSEPDEVPEQPSARPAVDKPPRELGLLLIALKALSQRAIAAIADMFTLLTVFGVWWLWWAIPDPNPNQIVALSIFAIFVLAANWLVRRPSGR